MQCRCSCVILLRQEHHAVVEQVRIRVVSVDQEDFGNVSASRPALDVDDDIEGIGDVGLDGPIGELHAALQNTACEACEALLRGVRMDGGQRAGVPGVQELQEIEGFATANLSENDAVRAVAEGSLQEIANSHCRKAVLFPARFKPDKVFLDQVNLGGVFDDEDPFLLRNEFSEDRYKCGF